MEEMAVPEIETMAVPNEGLENSIQQDSHDMRRMGKRCSRNFQIFAISSFTMISMMGWIYIPINGASVISVAGTGGLIVLFIANFFGFSTTVISLAEMASMAPTAGGQYHWTSEFAPPSIQKPLSYISGWLSTLSWLGGVASGMFLSSQLIPAIIALQRPEYYPQPWHSYLILLSILSIVFTFNAYLARYLPAVEIFVVCLAAVSFIAILTSVLVLSPKLPASEVFQTFTPSTSTDLLEIFGSQALIFYFTCIGFDSPVHLAEETLFAARVVPQSMVWTYFFNGLTCFAMVLVVCFCWIAPEQYLNAPNPFLELFRTATGSYAGSVAIMSIIIVLITFAGINFTASTTRQVFAFARDEGLPFSTWLSKVNSKTLIPTNALIAVSMFPVIVCLIGLGSTVAFNAIVSLQAMAIAATYQVSLICLVWRRLFGRPLPNAPWSLGKWGLPLNLFSIFYGWYLLVYASMPGTYPVTAENLNWAPVIFGLALLLSFTYYVLYGRKIYRGPVVKVIHEE